MNTLAKIIFAPFLLVASFFHSAPAPQIDTPYTPAPIELGASLPGGVAVFETALQSAITTSAATMTLASNSVQGGSTLSGFNCFTIDEGSAQAEYVCGTVSGTSVSGMTRGVDPITATTTNATLQFAHRRGANVKITDFPLIQIMRNQLNGSETIPNLISYTNDRDFSTASTSALVTYGQLTRTAFAGVSNATEVVKGISELATKIEQASSTPTGSTGASTVLQASYATSTYNAGSAGGNGLNVVVTRNNNTIDPNFIGQSSSDVYNFSSVNIASSTLASTTAYTINAGNINATSTIRATSFIGNGAGLTNIPVPRYTYASSTIATTTSALCSNCGSQTRYASTTPVSITIPAGILTASSTISVKVNASCTAGSITGSGSGQCYILLRKSTGETIWAGNVNPSTGQNIPFGLSVDTIGNNSVSSQISIGTCSNYNTSGNGSCTRVTQSSSIDFSQSLSLVLVIQASASGTGGDTGTISSAGIDSYSIIVNP